MSKVSDEKIIAALLQHGTIKATAAAVGLSERAVYTRMNDGDFQTLYRAAKNDIMRAAVFNINNQLQAAIDTVIDVMQNEDNNAAIRLQAAQTILNQAGKFSQRLQTDETATIAQAESSLFCF